MGWLLLLEVDSSVGLQEWAVAMRDNIVDHNTGCSSCYPTLVLLGRIPRLCFWSFRGQFRTTSIGSQEGEIENGSVSH